ncbi:MAG: hypothetical protein ABI691_06195 [Ginsengibacter sp.]
MKRFLLIICLQCFAHVNMYSQSFNIDDLISLISMPSKNIDRFMGRNKYALNNNKADGDAMMTSFVEKVKSKKKDEIPSRSVDMYKKNGIRFYAFHTTSLGEYLDGQRRLVKEGYFYDTSREISNDSPMLFQKKNLAIWAIPGMKDSVHEYSFVLEEKVVPDVYDIKHAEDLLKFTSHEFLLSFFGKKNVEKDLLYFAENQLKKCSVLFGHSSRQVVFVWNDENNLTDLAYILVSNMLPTQGAEKYDGVFSNNEWKLESGIYAGMNIRDLISLNENDFEIYGNSSEFAFMVKPGGAGKIDFNKTEVMLSCKGCNTDRNFDKPTVRARDIVRENFPMYIFDIIIYPSHH